MFKKVTTCLPSEKMVWDDGDILNSDGTAFDGRRGPIFISGIFFNVVFWIAFFSLLNHVF